MKVCIKITTDEEGRYLAHCPSLPGCTSSGRTAEEARKKISEAIMGYLAAVNNFVPSAGVVEQELVLA